MASLVTHRTWFAKLVNRNFGTPVENFKNLDNKIPCPTPLRVEQIQVI